MAHASAYRDFIRPWPLVAGIAGAVGSGVSIATLTAVYSNPLFRRMTPVRLQDWCFLIATSLLIGVLAATYFLPTSGAACENRIAGGGFLSVLAIGCPVCNKVVVMLLGISGALNYWAPIQPLLAMAGLALLAWALRLRLGALRSTGPVAS
jgi:hypothetical protein